MVLALNMMDEVTANGGTIHVNELEAQLGIPVVPISAAKNEGISELVEHAIHVARYREHPGRLDFCDENGRDNGAVHRCIHATIHLIEDHAKRAGIPVRFAATKLMEGDLVTSIEVVSTVNTQSVVLQTENGYFLKFMLEEIPEKKKSAVGVRGMKVDDSDNVDEVYIIPEEADVSIQYRDKDISLKKLRLSKRDSKGQKK